MSAAACIAFAFFALFISQAFGHGRSEEMIRMLNAPPPDWLSIGAAIKVEPDVTAAKGGTDFRPRSGGATNSRNRVQIPSREIEIRLDYEIDWAGNNEAGIGASLSPDGTKLIVNSGLRPHLYEITPSGEHLEVPIQLPHVTYDKGLKGFITGWFWADDQTLIGEAEINTERGEFIENRIYVFFIKESVLSRLDLSGLGLPTTEGLRVTKIAADLTGLRLSLGDTEFAVKADLKSAPQPVEQRLHGNQGSVPAPENHSEPKKVPSTSPEPTTSEEQASSTPWSIVVVLIVAATGLLWLLKRRA
jgi:hypothetical protein